MSNIAALTGGVFAGCASSRALQAVDKGSSAKMCCDPSPSQSCSIAIHFLLRTTVIVDFPFSSSSMVDGGYVPILPLYNYSYRNIGIPSLGGR